MSKGTHPRTALGQTAAQMIRRYYLHDVARDSAALTYYLLFAIFPLLIFVSTLLGILELDVDSIVTGLRQIVPGDVAEVVRGYLEYVSGNASRQLMWFSLVFSIWFPMRAASCLMHSVRKAMGRGRLASLSLICSRKAGYTVHNFRRITGLIPFSSNPKKGVATYRVSAESGSGSACHCRAPSLLNPQHQPSTGRRGPTQGTSSMCPLADF